MADLQKLMEEIKSMTVLELSKFVKELEEEFGVSAAAPVAVVAGGAAEAAPAEEEKTEFDVILKEVGPNKVQVIKVVKDATGLSVWSRRRALSTEPPRQSKKAFRRTRQRHSSPSSRKSAPSRKSSNSARRKPGRGILVTLIHVIARVPFCFCAAIYQRGKL